MSPTPDRWITCSAVTFGLAIVAAFGGPLTWKELVITSFLMLVFGASLALFQAIWKPGDK